MADELTPREDAWRSLFHSFEEPAGARQLESLGAAAEPPARPFSFFDPQSQSAIKALVAEFDQAAGGSPKGRATKPDAAQLRAVMDHFHAAARANVPLAQWALRSWIARWPGADVLPMPTLREQLAVNRKDHPERFEAVTRVLEGLPQGEEKLAYYRHDLDLSDHHLHWHMLYQFSAPVEGMQGRLFLWMHQQMLARYDTERFAAGLAPVAPFLAWNQPASWQAAFDDRTLPKDPLAPWIGPTWIQSGSTYVAFDEHGQSPADHDSFQAIPSVLAGLKRVHDRLSAGDYDSYDAIGAELEASSGQPDAGPHNNGHMAFASVPGHPRQVNVMANPEVAMTTPIFYRWHRAIDDFGFAWQEAQNVAAAIPAVSGISIRRGSDQTKTRSLDVILTPRSAIDGIEAAGFDLNAWGEAKFGGAAFDAPAAAALDVDELVTVVKADPAVPGLSNLTIETDWAYFFRLANDSDTDRVVTIRVWLAATGLAANRRSWIEMDKFVAALPKQTKTVVGRGSWQSTVVRRKSVDEPMQIADTKDEFVDDSDTIDDNAWCECGLPYRLLLPRGTAEGMPARLMVLVTDAEDDGTAIELKTAQCGSVSFCGKKNQSWPDKYEMGWPFDRPFPAQGNDPVFAFFDPLANLAWRDLTIRTHGQD